MHPLVFVFLGAVIGSLLTLYFQRRRPAGVLRASISNEDEGPSLILELYDDISEFISKDYVTFEIDRQVLSNSRSRK